jgi:hypothetical protein
VLVSLKDVVNRVTIMLEQTMENINLVKWVMKIADRIKKSVLIALNHVIVQKNKRTRIGYPRFLNSFISSISVT